METLYIHYRKILVGTLKYDSLHRTFNFTYNDNWKKDGFELSPALKFSGFEDYAFKLFIDNLLPEGKALDDISIYYHISKGEKFALLKKIGIETTGALTFSDEKAFNIPTSFREVSEQELEQRVKNKEIEPINVWDKKLRLSVAGVQEKLPIAIINKRMGFGEGDICSTHILKFNKKDENVILNEYISMKLADAVGLNVSEVEYKTLGSQNILFVKRFDREILSESFVERSHIIDSVQALGMPPTFKYEKLYGLEDQRKGVSFEKLFALLDEAKTPIVFKEQLIIWSMINLILGNSDAHGKNISFFVGKDGLEVTPFYDLVNITMYKHYNQEMAMAIDDEFEFEQIKVFDLSEFLEQNSISRVQYFNDFKKLTQNVKKQLDFDYIEKALILKEGAFIQDYKINIITRTNRLIDVVNGLRYELPNEDESYEEFYDYNEDIVTKRVKDSGLSKEDSVKKYLVSLGENLIKHL